jgi:hypothetical protein
MLKAGENPGGNLFVWKIKCLLEASPSVSLVRFGIVSTFISVEDILQIMRRGRGSTSYEM